MILIAALSVAGGEQSRATPRTDPPPRSAPARPVRPPARPAQDVYFANCTAARAAGRENIRRGEPGYRPPLDRDNDGVACESR